MEDDAEREIGLKSRFLMSKRTQHWSRVAYAIGSKFSGHPLTWNLETNLAERLTREKSIVVWKLFCCVGAFQLLYVSCRLTFVLLDETIPLLLSYYMRLMAMAYSICGIFVLGVILHRNEVHQFHNNYIKFGERFEELFVSIVGPASSHKYALLCGYIIQGTVMSMGVIGIGFVLKAFLMPESLDCLSSLLPLHLSTLLATRIASAAYTGAFFYCYVSSAVILGVTGPPFMIQTIIILEELGQRTQKWTSDRLRRRGKFSRIWNCLQLQINSCNEIYSNQVLWWVQVIMVMLISTTVYMSLTTTGPIRLLVIVLGLAFVAFIPINFVFFAYLHSLSAKLLEDWKSTNIPRTGGSDKQERGIFSRVLASYRPLKISFQGTYFVDKPLLLTMLDLIICNTVALLMLRE